MPKVINFRDKVGEALAASKKAVSAALQRRMGPPPRSVASRAQGNDEYRAYWRLGQGWEDPSQHEAKAAAMYAQGAKPGDVLKVMYPFRVDLLVLADRRDNLPAQVKFADEMVTLHMEELAGKVGELRDQLDEEGA